MASSRAGGAAGRTTTLLSNYGAIAGTLGVLQTNVTFDSVLGVQTCLAATRATIGGLRVNPDSVDFVTEQQRRTVGFNLFALADPFGGSDRRQLNERFVRSPLPDSIRPILYHVETGPIVEPYLIIEEIEVGGRRRELGPFAVRNVSLREAVEDFEARLLRGGEREIGGARLAAPPASIPDKGRVRSGHRLRTSPQRLRCWRKA